MVLAQAANPRLVFVGEQVDPVHYGDEMGRLEPRQGVAHGVADVSRVGRFALEDDAEA
jgi:hypothetical protein